MLHRRIKHDGACCPCVLSPEERRALKDEERERERQSVRHCLQLLLNRGWTQGQIARRLDTTKTQVSRWKVNGVLPKPPVRARLFALEDETPPRSMDEVVLFVMKRHAKQGVYGQGMRNLHRQSGFSRNGVDSSIKRLKAQGLIRELNSEPYTPRLFEV